jgi:hypothetical protein
VSFHRKLLAQVRIFGRPALGNAFFLEVIKNSYFCLLYARPGVLENREHVSKRTIYATEANSVVNLAARTATMDAGYPAGRVERLVSPEVRYVIPGFAHSWPPTPGIAVYSSLEGLLIRQTALLEALGSHLGCPPSIENPGR